MRTLEAAGERLLGRIVPKATAEAGWWSGPGGGPCVWTLLIIVGLAVACLAVVVRRLRRRLVMVDVVGISMEPTLRYGDRVLVRRAHVGEISRGDLVVLTEPFTGVLAADRATGRPAPPSWTVKRAVALPGDVVPAEVRAAVS